MVFDGKKLVLFIEMSSFVAAVAFILLETLGFGSGKKSPRNSSKLGWPEPCILV